MSKLIRRRLGVNACALMLCAGALQTGTAGAQEGIERLALPDNNPFPISAEVTALAGTDLYFLSGAVAPLVDKSAPAGSAQAYGGDMETQATNTLTAIKGTLEKLGLTMGDVIKMTVFMVGDPTTHQMDFKGFMGGYTKFFGTTEQPNKPARSAFQVAARAAPGPLSEIEVIAAKPHKKAMKAKK